MCLVVAAPAMTGLDTPTTSPSKDTNVKTADGDMERLTGELILQNGEDILTATRLRKPTQSENAIRFQDPLLPDACWSQ